MGATQSINQWFLDYLDAERADGGTGSPRLAEKERLYREYLAPRIGETSVDELTDDGVSELWEELETSASDRTELFSVLALLRALLSYVGKATGRTMPDLFLRRSFVTQEGLPEISAFLFDDLLTRDNTRHAMCFWLLLHTDLPLRAILRLRDENLTLDGDTFIAYYDRRTRIRKDAPKPKQKYIGTLTVLLSTAETAWWQTNLEQLTGGEVFLASGTAEPETRRRLNLTLNGYAERGGIDRLTVERIEQTEWDRSESEDEDRYFEESESADVAAPAKPEGAEDAGDIFALPELLHVRTETDGTVIPSEMLDEMMSVFPTPVLEHCRRVRQLSAFILEHIRTENWFLDTDSVWRNLPDAIYYHDLGKTALTLDDYYSDGKINSEQSARYRTHTTAGVTLLQSVTELPAEDFAPDSFGGMIRDAMRDHHERFDGKGFPAGKKGNEISVAGRLAALADALDHKLFVSKNIDTDTDAVLEELVKRAGTRYDARLVRVLTENREVFLSFVDELRAHYRGRRTGDNYGMRFRFHTFRDTDDAVAMCEAHLFLNDPYYGVIDSEIILPAMEDHPRYPTFTRLELKRLCRLICSANENNLEVPPIFVKIAVGEVERENFFTNLFRIFVNCGIRYRQLTVMLDEGDAIAAGTDLSGIADKFHMIGANFALCNFGGEVTLLPSLGRVRPDCILLKKSYADAGQDPVTEEMLKNILSVTKKMEIPVVCPFVGGAARARYLADAGVVAFGGDRTDGELSEGELFPAAAPAELFVPDEGETK